MKRSESDLVGLLGDIYAAGLGDRRTGPSGPGPRHRWLSRRRGAPPIIG